MINRNDYVELEDRIVAIGPGSNIERHFLPLLWHHNPRALLFCPGFKPAALMVRRMKKSYDGWRFPSTTVPIPPDIYSSLVLWGSLSLLPLVRMVKQSDVCLSFEFDDIDDKLLMAPYQREFGLDPSEAIYLKGDYKDCQWLQYQRFVQDHPSALKDKTKCVMGFEEYVEYLKTPEVRLCELYGLSIRMD